MVLLIGFMFFVVLCFIVELNDEKTVKKRTQDHIKKQKAIDAAIKKSKRSYKSDFKEEETEEKG